MVELFPCLLDFGFFGGSKKERHLEVGFFGVQDIGSFFTVGVLFSVDIKII